MDLEQIFDDLNFRYMLAQIAPMPERTVDLIIVHHYWINQENDCERWN